MRKRILWVIGIMLLNVLNGCEKINELTTFTFKDETEFSIPSQSGLRIPLNLRSPEVQTSAEQSFKNNNTKAELVETAQLSELVLAITAPENQNFNFLNEINISIKDTNGNTELIAFKKDIPENGSRVIYLETTDTNLKPFLLQESYSIVTDVITDQVVNQDVTIKINMTFQVKAKIL